MVMNTDSPLSSLETNSSTSSQSDSTMEKSFSFSPI